jgi:hypothetical protein
MSMVQIKDPALENYMNANRIAANLIRRAAPILDHFQAIRAGANDAVRIDQEIRHIEKVGSSGLVPTNSNFRIRMLWAGVASSIAERSGVFTDRVQINVLGGVTLAHFIRNQGLSSIFKSTPKPEASVSGDWKTIKPEVDEYIAELLRSRFEEPEVQRILEQASSTPV